MWKDENKRKLKMNGMVGVRVKRKNHKENTNIEKVDQNN